MKLSGTAFAAWNAPMLLESLFYANWKKKLTKKEPIQKETCREEYTSEQPSNENLK